jgi:hypothetical protein
MGQIRASIFFWEFIMSTLSPAHVLSALARVEHDWPALVGKEWPTIESQYRELRSRLECTTGPDQMRAAADLIQLFAPYAAARERLSAAITRETEEGSILLSLADLADQLGLDPSVSAQFKEAAQPEMSQRYIWQSSPTNATSLKLENVILRFEPSAFSEFLISLLTTAMKDVLGEPNVVFKAMGVLLLIASLYKAASIKLDEREATVFCGLARASRKDGSGVKEKQILEQTNAIRREVGLKALDKQELSNALHKLAEIKTIERVAGQHRNWRIVEKYDLKHGRQ